MIDIEKFLDRYRNNTTVRYGNGCIFITPPFFYPKTDDSIVIKVTENEQGLIVLSDCHTTQDYLDELDVELSDYEDKLQKIIKKFGLVHDGNVFRMTIPSLQDVYIDIYFGYFIQALSLIAHIHIQ